MLFLKKFTEKEYQEEIEKIKEENIQIEYNQNIKKERNKLKQKHKLETSKLIALYLFALLNAIIIYAMVAMWKFTDFTYLGVLISDIAAQVLIYAIYCMKAYKAKKSEEELRLERDKLDGSLLNVLEDGAESNEIVSTSDNVETFNTNNLG